MTANRQPGQECRNIICAKFGWMAAAVKPDKETNPVTVRLLCFAAVMQGANGIAHAIQ